MGVSDEGFFETDSPGDAARQFRYALGAFLGSVVVWIVALAVYTRTTYFGTLPTWVLLGCFVVGFVLELSLFVVFVRCGFEYASWVTERIEWLG